MSYDSMRRGAERILRRTDQLTPRPGETITVAPTDPEPATTLVQIDRRTDVDCDRRPYRREITTGWADDHPPRLDITADGTRIRLEIDPSMSAHQVREIVRHLRPEVQAWLVEVAEYAHDLEMREASEGLPAGSWEVSR